MTFRYFAYGSNLWPPQIRSRCPSARVVASGTLREWAPVYDKPSVDGSAKLNIRPDPGTVTHGVVYEIDDSEHPMLDESEPLYTPTIVTIDGTETLTYTYIGQPTRAMPYDWYVATVVAGAIHQDLPLDGLEVAATADPIAPGLRPANGDDLGAMQAVLSEGLMVGGDRYYIHPGDLAWWMYHSDPRMVDRVSYWIQAEDGFVVIDSSGDGEISAFARPGRPLMPLVRWSQRRLSNGGELGWVCEQDHDLESNLSKDGYTPASGDRSFEWDFGDMSIPEPSLPDQWELRHVKGETEANARRAASHAAFESTMDPQMHLERYLRFMRSPIYEAERDLVAIAPDGTIAAFMVWWPDVSGIAQIEPFGTHPAFHRRGVGRALIHFGLRRMKAVGMRLARVCTDEGQPATGFYKGVGFRDVGRLRWWAMT